MWHPGAFCHAMALRLVGLTLEQPAVTEQALQSLLSRFDRRWGVVGFPGPMKPITRGGLLYALGVLAGMRPSPRALELADELEEVGLRLYDMVASQIRASYHGCRGEIGPMREHERLVELHAIQNGSSWQAEAWASLSHLLVYRLTFDVVGLKRTIDELERLARDVPSFARYAQIARAELCAAHGEHDQTVQLLEPLLASAPRRGFTGWSAATATLAEAYNGLGEYARAQALCTAALQDLPSADRAFAVLYLGLEIELGLAEAGLGRQQEAARRLDALLQEHAPGRVPTTLGALHRARARIARAAGDAVAARHHYRQMDTWFRSTSNPALIAESERQALALSVDSVAPPQANATDDSSQEATRATPRNTPRGRA